MCLCSPCLKYVSVLDRTSRVLITSFLISLGSLGVRRFTYARRTHFMFVPYSFVYIFKQVPIYFSCSGYNYYTAQKWSVDYKI